MKITQEARDFAAKQNRPSDAFIGTEEAEDGMVEMSERFRDEGGETYLPSGGVGVIC